MAETNETKEMTMEDFIAAWIFALGKDKFSILFNGWNRSLTAAEFSIKFSCSLHVATMLVNCFIWAENKNYKPWTE